jgi:hypothetical protein
MKIDREHISWGGPDGDWWWLYFAPNWLPPDCRYFGYTQDWYDGPLSTLGLWWFNFSWRLPWTRHSARGGWIFRSKEYAARIEKMRSGGRG